MLAIFGALILIDRVTAYLFTYLVVLIAPVIIIMYSCMQSFRDSLFLSIGILILTFILGNVQMTYLIFIPVGVVTGLIYAYAVKKGCDKSVLILLACITYAVGELLASYVVYPLFGFPVQQLIDEMKISLNQAGSIVGMNYADIFSSAGFELDKIIVIIFFISTIFTGVMEGFIIHIFSVFLLKRFKIKDLGRVNVFSIKPNKPLAYASIISIFFFFYKDLIKNELLYYILLSLALIGSIILIFYGYIFCSMYGGIVYKKNIGFLLVMISFLFPVLLVALIVIGFLYASGPLKDYINKKMSEIKHE